MMANYDHNPNHDQVVNPAMENEDLWFAFDDGHDARHGLALNASKDEDEDKQSLRECHHGHDIHHDLAVISNHGHNYHHGLALNPFDVQLQNCTSHHGCDDDHNLAVMALGKIKVVYFKGVTIVSTSQPTFWTIHGNDQPILGSDENHLAHVLEAIKQRRA